MGGVRAGAPQEVGSFPPATARRRPGHWSCVLFCPPNRLGFFCQQRRRLGRFLLPGPVARSPCYFEASSLFKIASFPTPRARKPNGLLGYSGNEHKPIGPQSHTLLRKRSQLLGSELTKIQKPEIKSGYTRRTNNAPSYPPAFRRADSADIEQDQENGQYDADSNRKYQ